MTSGNVEATDPLLATVQADELRAALAVALFASTQKPPHVADPLHCLRITLDGEGRMFTQATDRYTAALYRGNACASRRLDVLVPRNYALGLAKALRTAKGEVRVEPFGAGPAWQFLYAAGKGAEPTISVLSWVPNGSASTMPRLTRLLACETREPTTAVAVEPAMLGVLAEWQRIAGGDYVPPNGAMLAPLSGQMLRATVTTERDYNNIRGLVALFCGVRLRDAGDDLSPYAGIASQQLLDSAPEDAR